MRNLNKSLKLPAESEVARRRLCFAVELSTLLAAAAAADVESLCVLLPCVRPLAITVHVGAAVSTESATTAWSS